MALEDTDGLIGIGTSPAADAASPKATDDAASSPTRPPKRARKELTEEDKLRLAERQWMARKAKALKAAKTPEEQRRVLEELNARAGVRPPPPAPAPTPASPTAVRDAPPAQAAAQVLPPPPAGRPGWPTDAEIDAVTPELSELWALIGVGLNVVLQLKAPAFASQLDIFRTRSSVVMGEDGKPRPVQTTGHAMLVKGTAPVCAKYAPAWMNTPEAVAIASIVGVFGAPLIAVLLQTLQPAAPTGAAPAPPPPTEGAA